MQNFREEEKFLKVIKHRQPIGMTDYSGVRGFSGDSMAKYCLLMQKTPEMWVPSLIQEDPLEKKMATHSSIILLFFFTPVFLPEKSHGKRSLAGYSLWGHKEKGLTEQMGTFMYQEC